MKAPALQETGIALNLLVDANVEDISLTTADAGMHVLCLVDGQGLWARQNQLVSHRHSVLRSSRVLPWGSEPVNIVLATEPMIERIVSTT